MVDRSGGLSGFSFGGMVPGGKEDLLFFTSGSFRVTPLELEEALCDVIYLHIFYSLTH